VWAWLISIDYSGKKKGFIPEDVEKLKKAKAT
jgi:hypothetical protein